MPISRRHFLSLACSAPLWPLWQQTATAATGSWVNDIHSQLNSTHVSGIIRPTRLEDLHTLVRVARETSQTISIAGGRHAMGGQQFGSETLLLDMTGLNRFLNLDREKGIVTVEAGIMWPQLIEQLNTLQKEEPHQWGIIQKQTGADRLSLGGALAANVHGRGLAFKPIISNVEAFELLDAAGQLRTCSRTENPDLFRLVIGGYGLFGIVTKVRLRLWPRKKVQRVVEIGNTETIMEAFAGRIRDGFLYGDYQFATDSNHDSFLRRGVFSCYRPVAPEVPVTPHPTRFHPKDWERLTYYSHTHKRLAFSAYTSRYGSTSGQIYWADSQLSGAYVDDYHVLLDRKMGAKVKGTEMITEIYVPRPKLAAFMEAARNELRRRKANLIYGTVRLIEKDDESFLAWAKESFVCIIFNLHIDHTPEKIEAAAGAFRSLIDLGISCGGSYYLTYHRFATREQVLTCYPQFPEFLRLKLKYDPEERFQSNWYRHYRQMVGPLST
ncbi:MAG: FAD-binding oxidoreductase [Blastocatellia bacterium]|nr:FAD-binding oxidoreductase [Blastocatellia bacterium]